MKVINGLAELKALVGQEIGVTEWYQVTQEQINKFAEATGDHQWIHVDMEKAKMFSPFKTTIAHGFLTLSLSPMFMEQLFKVEGVKMGVNYGTNKVRFMSPVPSGGKVRMRATLAEFQEIEGGGQIVMNLTFEIEGQEKPACVAEALSRFYA